MGASHPARREGLPIICGKTQVSKATESKAAAEDCPPYQPRCVWFCLVGRVTPCAPSLRPRFTTRPPPPWPRRDERENAATAFRLPPIISVPLCLITRIDRGELRLYHFSDKLAKNIRRLRPETTPASPIHKRIVCLTDPLLCWREARECHMRAAPDFCSRYR